MLSLIKSAGFSIAALRVARITVNFPAPAVTGYDNESTWKPTLETSRDP
jgi:hypothetical protein